MERIRLQVVSGAHCAVFDGSRGLVLPFNTKPVSGIVCLCVASLFGKCGQECETAVIGISPVQIVNGKVATYTGGTAYKNTRSVGNNKISQLINAFKKLDDKEKGEVLRNGYIEVGKL